MTPLPINFSQFNHKLVVTDGPQLVETSSWEPYFSNPDNQRTWEWFRDTVIDHVGINRMGKITRRLEIDLAANSFPLTGRTVTKLIETTKIITKQEMKDAFSDVHFQAGWTERLDENLRNAIMRANCLSQLDQKDFAAFYWALTHPFDDLFVIGEVEETWMETIFGILSLIAERFVHTPFERVRKFALGISKLDRISIDELIELVSVNASIFEEREIGTLFPAPNDEEGCPQFYELAAKLVTGQGQVSLFLVPMSASSQLPYLRLVRGTTFSISGLDPINHFLTDLEEEIGRTGYESGLPYEEFIANMFNVQFHVAGMSIGGAIAQWIVAHHPERVSHLTTIRAPGVPWHVQNTFNQRVQNLNRPLPITTWTSHGDFVHYVGERRLGHDSPDNVPLDYREVRGRGIIPHMSAPLVIQQYPGFGGGHSQEEINDLLSQDEFPLLERVRQYAGRYIAVPIFKFINEMMKLFPENRTERMKGLYIGNERIVIEPPYIPRIPEFDPCRERGASAKIQLY